MTVSIFDAMNGMHFAAPHHHHQMAMAIPRPQVSIERLPARRPTNEPRESMNCKSCRKRKIKCNRLRPSCEACQVFQCPCVYDAVPKKRGPKTDVLEALLKRVDGLEAQLKDAKSGDGTPITPTASPAAKESGSRDDVASDEDEPKAKRLALDTGRSTPSPKPISTSLESHIEPMAHSSVSVGILFDTYFSRFHGKPFYILDESFVKQRLQLGQLPRFLTLAICAVAARYTPHPSGFEAALKSGQEFVAQSRAQINTDEPSVDALQTLLLLVLASMAAGRGKAAYSLMTTATGMAMALEIHREMDSQARITPVERETRRRLFWSCYLLDRFVSCGSKRPSLVDDKAILLRLPTWLPNPSSLPVEGDFFRAGSNLQGTQDGRMRAQGNFGGLIDITRIMGLANRYLAAGGVKADSHFPWHQMSTHSNIRHELDTWASGTDDVFGATTGADALFRQADAPILVLGKLIYHLIHCLIYRPFLPIDLAELNGPGQHQPWQIDATNACFLHANAITELVDLGKQATSGTFEWPTFVGYCIATAAAVHVHGAHYNRSRAVGDVTLFGASADFLARDMQHLSELRHVWACVQHQYDAIQRIRKAHGELMKSLAAGGLRYTSAFQMSDFFHRYLNIGGPGGSSYQFETAHLSLLDVSVDIASNPNMAYAMYGPPRAGHGGVPERRNLKRKNTAPVGHVRPEMAAVSGIATLRGSPTAHRHTFSHVGPPSVVMQQQQPSPVYLPTPMSLPPHPEYRANMQNHHLPDHASHAVAVAAEAAGFPLSPPSGRHALQCMTTIAPYTPPTSGIVSSPAATDMSSIKNEQQVLANSVAIDTIFSNLPSQVFGSPVTWHQEPDHMGCGSGMASSQGQSPAVSTRSISNHGSRAGTVAVGEGDVDPFLSLLESLAESGDQMQGQSSHLDSWACAT